MSQAVHAKGTKIQVETSDGSGVYSSLPEVGDITGPSLDPGEADVTTQDSGLGEEVLATMIKFGPVGFPMNRVPANALQKQVRDDQLTNRVRGYRILEKDGATTDFRAFVKTYGPKAPIGGARQIDVSLRLVAMPTYTG